MRTASKLTKYYIGFTILLAVAIGLLVYTFSQSNGAKADRLTDQATEQIANKLDTYIANNDSIPDSLSQAKINNLPASVSYTKVDTSHYKVCFDYKQASGGFDASWTALLGGVFGSAQSNSNPPADNSYFDGGVEFSHKKGNNCQTVSPSLYGTGGGSAQQSAAGQSCSSFANNDNVYGSLTVSSIDTSGKVINFSTDNQAVYDADGNLLPTISSKTYDANTVFCDVNSYKQTTAAAIKSGQSVSIYMQSASDTRLDEVDIEGDISQ